MPQPSPPLEQPPLKRLVRALRGQSQTPPPVWLMRQAGRYLPEYGELRRQAGSFLSLCYTPELAVEVTLQPVKRFGMDAAILFSDILVVPDALGVEVTFGNGNGPCLTPVRTLRDVAALRPERMHHHLAPVYDAAERAAQALPEGVALIGFAGAPWTIACYMVEGSGGAFTAAKLWAFGEPEEFQRLIDVLVEATAEHLIEQVRHGAEAVQLFDSWAGILPSSEFERWCIAPTRSVVQRFKAIWPDVPVIGFPRGTGCMLRRYAEATGVDAVSVDSGVSAEWAARELQPRWAVQGNLDPVYLLVGGTELTGRIRAILDALGDGPFVFNLGHGVLPGTPPGNVALLVEAVRAWRPRGEGATGR